MTYDEDDEHRAPENAVKWFASAAALAIVDGLILLAMVVVGLFQ